MKCAIVEYNKVHGEIIPTIVYLLNRIGFDVDIYVSEEIIKNDPFVYTEGIIVNLKKSNGIRFKALVERRRFDDYDLVVYNSVEPIGILEKSRKVKTPSICVIHNAGLLRDNKKYIDYFSAKNREPLFLGEFISQSFSGKYPFNWISPVVVADYSREGVRERKYVNFCVQGNFEYSRRDYIGLLEAVEELNRLEYNGFIVNFVGRNIPDGQDFYRKTLDRGLDHYFTFTENNLPYSVYYSRLSKNDFILPLIDSSNNQHHPYYYYKLTSSLSVSVGMGITPVLEKDLAEKYSISECSVTYSRKNMACGIKSALELNSFESKCMMNKLALMKSELLARSERNLNRLIERLINLRKMPG